MPPGGNGIHKWILHTLSVPPRHFSSPMGPDLVQKSVFSTANAVWSFWFLDFNIKSYMFMWCSLSYPSEVQGPPCCCLLEPSLGSPWATLSSHIRTLIMWTFLTLGFHFRHTDVHNILTYAMAFLTEPILLLFPGSSCSNKCTEQAPGHLSDVAQNPSLRNFPGLKI